MLIDATLWEHLVMVVGELTILIILFLVLSSIIIALIAAYSVSTGKLVFPRLLKSGLVFLEGLVKAFCRLFGLDDKELLTFFIRLSNTMNMKQFAAVPVHERAVFIPQCLRSSKCPANLTPEGLKCVNCGRCSVGPSIIRLQEMGYHVFIAPGSTLIKRMVKQYHPKAIVGIGCLMEVKEGLDLCDRIGIPAMGVVTLKDGCVETLVNWHDVFEVVGIGTENSVPEDFDVSSG
jgi:hypothetical protein